MMDHKLLRPRRLDIRDTRPTFWMNSAANVGTSSGKVTGWNSSYRTLTFLAGLAATRPTYNDTLGIMTFDGNDYLAANVLLSGGAGRIMVAMRHVIAAPSQVVFGTTDITAANTHLSLGVNGDGKCRYAFNVEGTEDELVGDTVLSEAWHILEWVSTGSAISMVVDGTAQTLTIVGGGNNGKWHDDVTGAGSHVIGTRWSSGGKTLYFAGWLGDIVAYEPDKSAGMITQARRALARKYSVTLA